MLETGCDVVIHLTVLSRQDLLYLHSFCNKASAESEETQDNIKRTVSAAISKINLGRAFGYPKKWVTYYDAQK